MAKKKRFLRKNKDSKYICGICGLVMSVDESSGAIDVEETICCGKKMRLKK
ncbi:MAG: hypothetical protein NC938_04360 [Candidatus Omnitrophica bacterium]|nr:hypothetical protein [Candidatus Omnitrophota bacterium]